MLSFVVTGVEDSFFQENPFKLYPNPATTDLILSMENRSFQAFGLTVVDSRGKRIKIQNGISPKEDGLYSISLQGLASGQYYLVVSVDGHVKSVPFIKE